MSAPLTSLAPVPGSTSCVRAASARRRTAEREHDVGGRGGPELIGAARPGPETDKTDGAHLFGVKSMWRAIVNKTATIPSVSFRGTWPSKMIGKLKQNLLLACLVISSVTVFYLGQHAMECHHRIEERSQPLKMESPKATLRTEQRANSSFAYNKDMPLIFIGGVPRSGTTLMRAMLDAHPEIRCGEETRVIPRILAVKQMWARSSKEKIRLDEAGVTDEVLDAAMQAFLLEIIVKHGEPAPYLCNKDPFALKSLSYLAKIFPNAKFVLMVRDGRASVHSMISRKVTIAGFDLNSYRDCLTKWNRAIETMYNQCIEVGYDRCMMVHYEQLVLHPERWMKTLLKFLTIPWNDAVLHHEEMIGKAGGVSLSKVERSTDQVIKPVNVDALSKWVGKIPPDVLRDMPVIAPMLAKLGYDPYANPPSYGKPDQKVIDNTRRNSR
ncbi:protein-tyrosine sulfotransferase 1 isoform X2 [Dendropsophus ebraccatus]|uniref:protein-tyrosine sulfotransferase 1 isoform X2 n=1 Tax=Dendropsophus ebraccatus TaxID=150705 RepID=UPI0038313BE9